MSSQTNTDNEQSFTRRMVALIDDHRDQVSDEFLRLAMKACKQEFDKKNESDSDSDTDDDSVFHFQREISALRSRLEREHEENKTLKKDNDLQTEQFLIVCRENREELVYFKNQCETLKKDNDYYTKKVVSLVREIDELKSVQHTHTHSQAQVVPKRTPNAYVLFSKDYREKVREGLPVGCKGIDVTRALGEQWRQLVQSTLDQDQAIVGKYHRLASELKRGTTSISQDY